MPVFGGGTTKFQPVFVDDVARAIELISRRDIDTSGMVDGKTIEAGGPDGMFLQGAYTHMTNQRQCSHTARSWSSS